jgi:hypothetical protein
LRLSLLAQCPRIAAEEQDYRPGILFNENMCIKSDAFCVALPQNAKFFLSISISVDAYSVKV